MQLISTRLHRSAHNYIVLPKGSEPDEFEGRLADGQLAVLAKVLEREIIEDWARFNMAVQNVYKRGRDSGLRRGGLSLWVHSGDLACKCPKIRSNKSYLILGKEKDGDRPGLTITQRSIVIEWKEEWHNRMRRFQRRSKQCN
ncbi:unnamed protein product [Nezara viridula]|uniref:NTR domain-containing protein n=1 Tax=Nezara viridula TaxID=85310 RepID=A0A9P0HAX2_NEZVI|nr:unnamed protein product [Nezara viridula]